MPTLEGNIGLHTGGGIPVGRDMVPSFATGRPMSTTGRGTCHFSSCHTVSIRSFGHVSSANNRTVSDSYPYYIATSFAMPYRINRIRQMIDSKEVHTVDDFKQMVTDQHSFYPTMLVPVVLAAV
jgi:penicillin G amidase